MKKIILMVALVATIGTMTETSAQTRRGMMSTPPGQGDWTTLPRPHRSIKPHKPASSAISYDAASTVLTVKFLSNSQGGTIEIFHDGAKVAGVTTNGGTTFSCTLREYGTGNYNVIVFNGNTVIDNKNYTVK